MSKTKIGATEYLLKNGVIARVYDNAINKGQTGIYDASVKVECGFRLGQFREADIVKSWKIIVEIED